MPVTVSIPGALRQYTKNKDQIGVDALNVDEALLKLDDLYPGLRALIVDEGRELRPYVNIFVNQDDIRTADGLLTKLKDGDQVSIIPAVAGGL